MKNVFTLLLAMLMVFGLAACGTTEPVVKFKTTLLTPEDQYLQDCAVAEPPDAKTYPTLSAQEKEKAMADYANAQTKNLALCNKDKAGLRKWKKEQQLKYNSITTNKGE